MYESPSRSAYVFRTARRADVLAGCGRVFRDQESLAHSGSFSRHHAGDDAADDRADRAADALYARSRPAARADAFVSHAWQDSGLLKWLALLYRANLARAVAASLVAWAGAVAALLVAARGDVAAYGGARGVTELFAVAPAAAFVVAFFHGHRLGEERWWVDKMCIHQRRRDLKLAAIRALPSFVKRSRRLVVLQSEATFSRLWCAFEIATFLSANPATEVDVVPLWLAPWVLAAMAVNLGCGLLSQRVIRYWFEDLMPRVVPVVGLLGATLFGCAATIAVAYAPAAGPLLAAFRARHRTHRRLLEQIDAFSLRTTRCSVEADRAHVEAHVAAAFRAHGGDAADAVAAFEAVVRRDLRREVRGGDGARTPFAVAALPFLPLAWTCAANVLTCSGLRCADAAAANDLGDDAAAYVAALALTWVQALLWAWSIIPFVFRVLERTERGRRASAAGAGAVLLAFGAWGVANGVGCVVVFAAARTGGAATGVAAAWFCAAVAWNRYLFRAP